MRTADLIAEEARQLPEHLALEVLHYIQFLQARPAAMDNIDTRRALELLEQPPLDLHGQYLSRDDCHARSQRALDINRRFGFSAWDALIVASALQSGCAVLYSEDMHDGQVIDGLELRNPFRSLNST